MAALPGTKELTSIPPSARREELHGDDERLGVAREEDLQFRGTWASFGIRRERLSGWVVAVVDIERRRLPRHQADRVGRDLRESHCLSPAGAARQFLAFRADQPEARIAEQPARGLARVAQNNHDSHAPGGADGGAHRS